MPTTRSIFVLIFRTTRLYRYPFCQQNTACAHMKMNGSHLIFRCCKREARCLQRINAQWAWLVLESVEKWSMGLEIFYILIPKSYYFKWSPNYIKNVHMPEFIAAPLIWTLCKERQNLLIFIAWTTDGHFFRNVASLKCQSKSYPKHSQFVNIHISFI